LIHSLKLRAYVLMLLVVAIWGSTFVVVKGALADATPAAFNLIRMLLAFAILALAYHRFWRGMKAWQVGAGAVVGFFLAFGYQFQTTGLARTTPSKSAFITGLLVVMVPFLSLIPGIRPPGAHPPRWNAFLGAGLAFVGILLLTEPTALSSQSSSLVGLLPDLTSINLGDVLTLGCALGFAFHCLALSHTSPRIGFQQLALLQVGFCALFMALSLPLIEHPHVTWTPRLLMALSIAALLATAAAFSVQSWVQAVLPSTHTALILTMEPVFAWITSFLVTGERLGVRPTMGALMILAGIALTELFPQPHLPSAHEA
jgi:drug/metabolite transporter (DMT)-like permease